MIPIEERLVVETNSFRYQDWILPDDDRWPLHIVASRGQNLSIILGNDMTSAIDHTRDSVLNRDRAFR